LNRFLGMIRKYYPYFAVCSGILSIFLSISSLITNAGLQFHFGSIKGHVNLSLGDPFVNMAAWIVVLLLFSAYPVVLKGARSSRLVVVSHGMILVFIVLMLLWPQTSPLLALCSIVAFLVALRGSPRVLGIPRPRMIALSLATLFGCGIPVELLALYGWSTSPFAALRTYSGASSSLLAMAKLELDLFYVGYGLVVWVILLLLMSPVVLELWAHRSANRQVLKVGRLDLKPIGLGTPALWGSLVGVSVTAALITYLPYSFSQYPVGIDSDWFYEVLDGLSSGNLPLTWLFHEPRAAYLLLLYATRLATQLPVRETAMAVAVIICVLFALGSFLVLREMGQGDLISLLGALFAVVSPQTLVGTLASIFSSWLAMAEVLFFFAFFLRTKRTSSRFSLGVSYAISLMILITHPWTYVILVFILAIHVVLSGLQNRSWVFLRRSAGPKILLASLLTGVIAFAIVRGLPVFQGIMDVVYSEGLLNLRPLRDPTVFLRDVQIALLNYSTQGLYSNWILLSLAIVGVLGLVAVEKETRVLFDSWVLGPALLFLFLGPQIQWRLLFLIPYNILGALGVVTLLGLLEKLIPVGRARVDFLILRAAELSFVMFLILLFLNNAVRSMTLIATQVVT